MKKFILIYFFMSICFISSLSAEEENLEQTIVLEVQWFPQSQFAGYIMASEKGFYKDLGLDVKISFSDGTDSPINKIVATATNRIAISITFIFHLLFLY